MHPAPTSPLGQAFAAIIHLLIAAIAEHAREHPLLAGGCRASIRQLEKLARRFQALADEWHQHQTQPRLPAPPRRPTPGVRPRTSRHGKARSRRRAIAMGNRAPAARAPPA
jgi:hypothetical protein